MNVHLLLEVLVFTKAVILHLHFNNLHLTNSFHIQVIEFS